MPVFWALLSTAAMLTGTLVVASVSYSSESPTLVATVIKFRPRARKKVASKRTAVFPIFARLVNAVENDVEVIKVVLRSDFMLKPSTTVELLR